MPTNDTFDATWLELQAFLDRDPTLTLTFLSQQSGLSLSYLSDLRNGRRTPNARVIAKIADVLRVPRTMLTPAARSVS